MAARASFGSLNRSMSSSRRAVGVAARVAGERSPEAMVVRETAVVGNGSCSKTAGEAVVFGGRLTRVEAGAGTDFEAGEATRAGDGVGVGSGGCDGETRTYVGGGV